MVMWALIYDHVGEMGTGGSVGVWEGDVGVDV
jgi:hypothetical protein